MKDRLAERVLMVDRVGPFEQRGRVSGMSGLTVEVSGLRAAVGAQCEIHTRQDGRISAEVVGFRDEVSLLMGLGDLSGIGGGDQVVCRSDRASVSVGPELLGRVINGFGDPIDDKGPLLCQVRRSLGQERLKPLERKRIDTLIGTGIRAIDTLMTCGRGQRMGIFSGPGVGKSVLLGMIGRYSSSDVSVIALVGERGREVREFIEKDLGPEGLARSVVVVSTSDEPPPLRVRASKTAAMIAESFRDQGKDVLLLMDSITRVAMAQRQIGLAVGEPPATKGYTPSVFSLLAGLVERSGLSERGSITGFYTVLVEGDDLSEPISDAMRGLLDGHVWLSRDLANKGHYPAIDVLESVSRVMVDVVDEQHLRWAQEIIRLVAVYRDIEDLVNIGAYAAGSNAEFDLAVQAHGMIDTFLRQGLSERVSYQEAVAELERLVSSFADAESLAQNRRPVEAEGEPAKAEIRRDVSPELARMMAGV